MPKPKILIINLLVNYMASGGYRKNAGRPTGQGKYGEPTKPMRVPVSMIGKVVELLENDTDLDGSPTLPLYLCSVQAGYPIPANDEVEDNIDLNKYLVKHPTATFLVRVVGDSMINAGINETDILVVDRKIDPQSGRIVVASVNGELTVKRLDKTSEGVFLMPENDDYQPIKIGENDAAMIWGVVTNVIHKV